MNDVGICDIALETLRRSPAEAQCLRRLEVSRRDLPQAIGVWAPLGRSPVAAFGCISEGVAPGWPACARRRPLVASRGARSGDATAEGPLAQDMRLRRDLVARPLGRADTDRPLPGRGMARAAKLRLREDARCAGVRAGGMTRLSGRCGGREGARPWSPGARRPPRSHRSRPGRAPGPTAHRRERERARRPAPMCP